VPLRFPRPAVALIAAGTAVISIGLGALPASADQARHSEWWLTKLGVTASWASSQGSGVTVAVLSDGVDTHQADLAAAVTTAPQLSGAPVASGQYFGEQGTAIASLIAGRGHGSGGSSGISGVAPKAHILSVPVTLPADDPELSQASVAAAIPAAIAAGINYAVKHGATVIDLPLDPGQPGAAGTGGASAAAGGSAAEQAAVKNALAHNVVLVAPAGDDGATTDAANYPAAYPGVIAVGAFDSAFNKAPWSSHQSYVTLTAAGRNVMAADAAGGYQAMNSTGAASAIVSGVAALVRSRYPALSAAQVKQALTSSTLYRRAGGLADGSGYGAVDADKALQAAARLATPIASPAGKGAQPLVAPASVAAPSSTAGIAHQVIRAGEVAGALLLILLLLIAVYALTGRRRTSRLPAITAEWTPRQAQSRYPQASAGDADRMLELFSTPGPEPRRQLGPASVVPGRVISEDHGVFAGGSGLTGADLAERRRSIPAVAADPGRLVSPASRAVSRQPVVSGSPPWEPASAPDSELPWTAAPGMHAAGARPAVPALPASAHSGAAPASFDQAAADDPMWHPAHQQHDAGDDDQQDWLDRQPGRPVRSSGAAGYIAASRSGAGARHRAAGQFSGDQFSGDRVGRDRFSSDQFGGDQNGGEQFSGDQFGGRQFGGGRFAGPSPEPSRQPDAWQPQRRDAWPSSQPDRAPAWENQPPTWQDSPPEPPKVAASGLPVRTPRQPTPAPLSPSGSLWDPVEREPSNYQDQGGYGDAGGYQDQGGYGQPGQYQEPAGYQGEDRDNNGQPIFVWDRPGQEQTESFRALPTDLKRARADWSGEE
jgi:hypothetical protein